MTTNEFSADISREIWISKYRQGHEADISTTWRRVAEALAAVERDDAAAWRESFRGLLDGFTFLPGGRILAGAGTGRLVTLPAILPPEAYDLWLDPTLGDPKALQPLLQPSPGAEWEGYPVGYYTRDNKPELIERH